MSDYFDTGFVYRTPAWHGKATVTDRRAENWQEAREWGGIDWEPIEVPVYAYRGIDISGNVTHAPSDGGVGDYFEEDGHKRVVRSDTGATLAVPRGTYAIITHTQMGEVADALGLAGIQWDTAGSTHGGKKVWGLGYLDEPAVVEAADGRRDESLTLPYAALTNSHDGTGALRVGYTAVRIVCANTWQASEREQDVHGRSFVFRHTAKWQDKIEEARAALAGVRAAQAEYLEAMGELLGVPVTSRQREVFIRDFVPTPPEGLVSDRVIANVEQAREAIRSILASPTTAPVADTAYGLVMAATEYLDHVRGYRNQDTLLGRQILRPEPLKAKAAKLALAAASA